MAYDPRYDEGTEILDMPPGALTEEIAERERIKREVAEADERRAAKAEMRERAATNANDIYVACLHLTEAELAAINAKYGTDATIYDLRPCHGCGNMVPGSVLSSYKRSHALCPECASASSIITASLDDMTTTSVIYWKRQWAQALCYYKALQQKNTGFLLPRRADAISLYDRYATYFDPDSDQYISPKRYQFNEDFATRGFGYITSERGNKIYKAVLDNMRLFASPEVTDAANKILEAIREE